jgi:hypothetical protein
MYVFINPISLSFISFFSFYIYIERKNSCFILFYANIIQENRER